MADATHAADIEMAAVQSELKAKKQEAISTINELFHEQENERSRREALLKEYAKLKDYLADRAVAYQTSLQQVKHLTEENARLEMSLSSLRAVHSHEQAVLMEENQKLKEDCAQKESAIGDLGKQITEKDDQIAKLKQDLDGNFVGKTLSPHQLGETERKKMQHSTDFLLVQAPHFRPQPPILGRLNSRTRRTGMATLFGTVSPYLFCIRWFPMS